MQKICNTFIFNLLEIFYAYETVKDRLPLEFLVFFRKIFPFTQPLSTRNRLMLKGRTVSSQTAAFTSRNISKRLKMYLIHTPKIIQNLFPGFVWQLPAEEPTVYLTFDDGPIPEITPWVLDLLAQYRAKATFFVVGENVEKHPDIYASILEAGHHVGNHTYHHLSGWRNEDVPYLHNVRKASQLVKSDLFRPPYGKLKPGQVQFLQRHYKIVMWDVLSGDFDASITPQRCIKNVKENVSPGSIVVFHDSKKAWKNLKVALPQVLEYLTTEGYHLDSIPMRRSKLNSLSNKETPKSVPVVVPG